MYMILKREHFGTAKVCGMRRRLLYSISIDKDEKEKIREVIGELADLQVRESSIKKINENEWRIYTEKKQYIVKKVNGELRVYEFLDELKGSMVTFPVAAQKRLGWGEIEGDREIDCLTTSKDVILYRLISYEPLYYKLYLDKLNIEWKKLDEELKQNILKTIILAPSLRGVYVTLDVFYPDNSCFDELRELCRRLYSLLPAGIEETYSHTRFHFTLASEELCEELYHLVNDRERFASLLKERGFVDFYWMLMKNLTEASRRQVENIADTLLIIISKWKSGYVEVFNRLLSVAKTARQVIWRNYSYALNIAFGHRGVLLVSHLMIMKSWDGVILYLMRLLEKLKELNSDDLDRYEEFIYTHLNRLAKKLKETVVLSKENLGEEEVTHIISLLADLYDERRQPGEIFDSIKIQKVMRNISFILDRLAAILRQALYMSPQCVFQMEEEDRRKIEEILEQRKKLFRVKIGEKLISLPKEVRKTHGWDENTKLHVFSPSEHTLVYYYREAAPLKVFFDLNKLPMEIERYPEMVLRKIIRDIVVVGSLIGPNVKVKLKLPERFRERQVLHRVCREVDNYVESSEWEDDFPHAEFTYHFELPNKTFQEILRDMCRRFQSIINLLDSKEGILEVDTQNLQLIQDHLEDVIKFFNRQFSIAVNIAFARGGIDFGFFFIIWRTSILPLNIHSIVRSLRESSDLDEKKSLGNIQPTFERVTRLLHDTIELIDPSQKVERDAVVILFQSMLLHSELSSFEKPLNYQELRIFEELWRIVDHIASISRFWIYIQPLQCLQLEETKVNTGSK